MLCILLLISVKTQRVNRSVTFQNIIYTTQWFVFKCQNDIRTKFYMVSYHMNGSVSTHSSTCNCKKMVTSIFLLQLYASKLCYFNLLTAHLFVYITFQTISLQNGSNLRNENVRTYIFLTVIYVQCVYFLWRCCIL